MAIFSVISLSLYYAVLCMFAFVSHPVIYCFFLLLCAGSVLGVLFSCLGFSWYILLFCLVYVGGVYVLFVFISVFVPNTSTQLSGSLALFLFLFLFFCGVVSIAGGINLSVFAESSHYICSYHEGFSYCVFCLVLLLGFSILSVVVSEKGSFFR